MRVSGYIACVFGLFCLASSGPVAQGQGSIYGTVAVTDFCIDTYSHTTCKSDAVGFLGGAFFNFPIESRVTVGIDGRGSYGLGSRGGMSATAALRVAFVPTHVRLRPYFELGAGVVSSAGHDPLQGTRHTSGAMQLAFGLDVRLTNSIDLRAAELGAAAGGGTGSTPGAGTAYLDGGIVYHFPKRKS